MGDYYVYVYIDPRNFEEFYCGQGKGHRKDQHLSDESDSDKVKRIQAIKDEGLEPTIRVIARGLSKEQALLIEKTLLWKLGKTLTNQATGNFADLFRPPNRLHLEISGFDYLEGLYYFNVGDGPHRKWADCKRLGYIGAGQGPRWRDAIKAFREGDVIAAYLKDRGFVGIGKITQGAKPVREVVIQGVPLVKHDLECKGITDNIDSNDLCEYAALVKWVRAVEPAEAKWKGKAGLYTTPLVRASLEQQPKTVKFLEEQFDLDFAALRTRRE